MSADTPREPKKRSIWSRAFWNQYNLILLGGAGLVAITTFSWLPLLIGAGAEALWMVLGADSRLFRHWVKGQEAAEQKKLMAARAEATLATLRPGYVERYEELEHLAAEIERVARENPSLEARLVQKEMDKLGQLLQTFIELAALHQRYGRFLVDNTEREMQRDIETAERALERETDREVKRGLQQSLALARKRLAQRTRIEATHRLVGVRMDTLEKSLRYLQSHIISIGRTEELSQEIQTLIVGVESVEALNLDAEQLLGDIA
ncbi:MAG TPA: hypothetical protein VNM90_25980 [Haliangium sp.]|nr:hypothetical protein [Haliangium sp.]